MSNKYKIIGEGMDGIIVHPAVPCSNSNLNINYNNYVSKFGRDAGLEKTKQLFDKLPNLKAYNNEAYLCDYDEEDVANINFPRKIGKKQLIVPYIEGKDLSKYIINDTATFTSCQWYKLLETMVNFYDDIAELRKHSEYHNDISSANMMYDEKNNRLLLVDFDRATFDKPYKLSKLNGYFERIKKYTELYDYDEKHAYINDEKAYINDIFGIIEYDMVLNDTCKEVLHKYNLKSIDKYSDYYEQFKYLKSVMPQLKKELCNSKSSKSKSKSSKSSSYGASYKTARSRSSSRKRSSSSASYKTAKSRSSSRKRSSSKK